MVVLTRRPSFLIGALAVICAQPFLSATSGMPGNISDGVRSETIIVDDFDASEEGTKARKKAVTALLVELKAIENAIEREEEQEDQTACPRRTQCLDLHDELELIDAGDYHEVAIALLDGLKPSTSSAIIRR